MIPPHIFTPPFVLRFTNQWGEQFYFQNLGALWPHDPRKHLIERTTKVAVEARSFKSPDEANETLVRAGQPSGWQVIDSAGYVVE